MRAYARATQSNYLPQCDLCEGLWPSELHVHACVHARTYACVYMCACVHVRACVCACAYVCVCTSHTCCVQCIRACVCVRLFTYVCACAHLRACVHAGTCACVRMCLPLGVLPPQKRASLLSCLSTLGAAREVFLACPRHA